MSEILKSIKKSLGVSCTFLAFETEKDIVFLKAIIKNNLGGKDTVKQKINVPLNTLTEQDYENMYNVLKERTYASV